MIAEAVVEEEAHLEAVVHQEDVEELVPRVVRRPLSYVHPLRKPLVLG